MSTPTKSAANAKTVLAAIREMGHSHSSATSTIRKQEGPKSAAGPFTEYIRVPGPDGVDPIFSIAREAMLDLVLPRAGNGFKPPVRSVLIKKPGAKRGARYVNVASLRAYMASLEAQAS